MALGIAAQLPDSIPDHMKVPGRAQRPGPVTGQVECLNLSMATSPTEAGTRARSVIKMTGPYTVLAVTWYVRDASAGSPQLQIVVDNLPTGKSASVVELLTADILLTDDGDGIIRSGDATMQNNKFVNADNSLPWLCIMARRGGADTLIDLAATVWFYRHTHINADTVND